MATKWCVCADPVLSLPADKSHQKDQSTFLKFLAYHNLINGHKWKTATCWNPLITNTNYKKHILVQVKTWAGRGADCHWWVYTPIQAQVINRYVQCYGIYGMQLIVVHNQCQVQLCRTCPPLRYLSVAQAKTSIAATIWSQWIIIAQCNRVRSKRVYYHKQRDV